MGHRMDQPLELPHVPGGLSMAILLPDVNVNGDLNAVSLCLLLCSLHPLLKYTLPSTGSWVRNGLKISMQLKLWQSKDNSFSEMLGSSPGWGWGGEGPHLFAKLQSKASMLSVTGMLSLELGNPVAWPSGRGLKHC